MLAIGPIVALMALALHRYRLALAAVLVTLFKLMGERIVWKFVDRERPGVTEPNAIVRGGTATEGVSFVSGHVVLVTGLAWVVTPYLRGRWRIVPWLVVALVASRGYTWAPTIRWTCWRVSRSASRSGRRQPAREGSPSAKEADTEEPGREAPAPSSG